MLVASLDGRLRYRTKKFQRPMGMAVDGNRLALAVRQQILQFERESDVGSDFLLRRRFHTGKVDAHDVAFGTCGIYFANTRYNTIACVPAKKRFVRCWQPPFIEGKIRGDRCHLNGIGLLDGVPKMATAFCATGSRGGWREQDRFTGGILMDVESNEIVTSGLCMPHSPRWHDGRWWLCNSGYGLLESANPSTGYGEEVCALPGFTRGLCFVGDHALVGLSKIRPKHILDAPPVRKRHEKLIAGVALVHWKSGKQIGTLEFVAGGNEVYEVLFLPEIRKPNVLKACKQRPPQAT